MSNYQHFYAKPKLLAVLQSVGATDQMFILKQMTFSENITTVVDTSAIDCKLILSLNHYFSYYNLRSDLAHRTCMVKLKPLNKDSGDIIRF